MTIIGIAGGTGSGKSTLLKSIAEHEREAGRTVISIDYDGSAYPIAGANYISAFKNLI